MSYPVYSGDQPQYHFARAQQERNDIARQITTETKATRRKRQCLDLLVFLLLCFLFLSFIVAIVALYFVFKIPY